MSSDYEFRTGGAFEHLSRLVDGFGYTDPLIGTQLSSYRIDRLIAEGGMGRVYVGHRVDGQFHRDVAIKVLPAGFNRERVRRFAQEREILARLSHPHIGQLFDAGVSEFGSLFLVMELVDGSPIDEYVYRESLHVDDVARLMSTLCEALTFAHAKLIVHRDLKPSNVFVSAEGELKLLDFGIAKMLESSEELTTDSRPMTLRYASPEQILNEPVSVASDIYQCGLLLAALLRSERSGTSDTPASATERANRKFSVRAERIVGRPLPADLLAIINKCLEADPADRYGSAGELAADLDSFLGGFPVRARNPGPALRAGKFLRRNWLPATAVALSGILIAASSAFYMYSLAKQRDAVLAANFVARTEAETANSVTRFLARIIAGANVIYTPEEPETVRDAVVKGAALLATELRDQPMVRARLAIELAGILNSMGEWAATRTMLDTALPELVAHPEVAFDQLWKLRSHAAYANYRLSAFDLARRQYEEIITVFGKAELLRHPIYADAWRRLALLERRAGNHELALEHIRRAEQVFDFHEGNREELANFLNHYGLVLSSLRDFDAAIARYRRSIDVFRDVQGEACPRCAITMINLTEALRKTGRIDEAHETILEAQATFDRALGDDAGPWRGAILIELASIANELGRYDQAVEYHRQADAHYAATVGEKSSLHALSLRNHALTHSDHGRCDRSIPLLEAARAVDLELFGNESPRVQRVDRHLSECEVALRQAAPR